MGLASSNSIGNFCQLMDGMKNFNHKKQPEKKVVFQMGFLSALTPCLYANRFLKKHQPYKATTLSTTLSPAHYLSHP